MTSSGCAQCVHESNHFLLTSVLHPLQSVQLQKLSFQAMLGYRGHAVTAAVVDRSDNVQRTTLSPVPLELPADWPGE